MPHGSGGVSAALNQAFGPRPGPQVVSVQSRGGGGGRNYGQINQFMQGQQQASQARYADIQKQLADTQARVRQQFENAQLNLGKVGKSGRRRIAQKTERGLASSEQDLISRGLGNTTLRGSARRDVLQRGEYAEQDLEGGLAQMFSNLSMQGAGLEMNLGQMGLQGMQGQPGMNQYLQMLQMLMSGGG